MMGVLRDISPDNSKKLENLLIQYMAKEEYQCRLIAVKYAIGIFPFHHVGARYVCLLGSADHHMEVRDHAKEGLLFPSQRARISFVKSPDSQAVPAFSELVDYIHKQISRRQTEPELLAAAAQKGDLVFTFAQECLFHILRFLRLTLLINAEPELLLDPLGEVLDPVLPSKVAHFLKGCWTNNQNSVLQYSKLLESSLDHKFG